ncbi:NADP-dependent oxidoreductase domain-containing protein [Lyophyllum atratum]|nr:NADP-dependent oxidoreductase domain-containing protein [Lyophyllum atratum]
MSKSVPNVQYRQLGKSGLRVSVPIIGAMSFGSPEWADWVLPEEPTMKILQAAWDLGINTIDTANVYSNGESERIIGKWIEQSKIPRERLIIATKCHGLVAETLGLRTSLMPELKAQRDYVNQSGLSRAAIFNAVDASLARLKLTYIDLLQIHRFDPDTPVEETMKALHDLVEGGKVRYIGASSMRTWQFALMNEVAEKRGWTKFVSMQDEYSLLYREEEREMIAYCKFNGIGLIPWAPLADGLLARPLNTITTRSNNAKGTVFERKLAEGDKQIISRVEEIAAKKGVKMAQVAIAWVAAKVSSPIIGVNSVERVAEGVTTSVTLSEEEMKYLEEPYEPKRVRGHA